jgi:hypothetical protein
MGHLNNWLAWHNYGNQHSSCALDLLVITSNRVHNVKWELTVCHWYSDPDSSSNIYWTVRDRSLVGQSRLSFNCEVWRPEDEYWFVGFGAHWHSKYMRCYSDHARGMHFFFHVHDKHGWNLNFQLSSNKCLRYIHTPDWLRHRWGKIRNDNCRIKPTNNNFWYHIVKCC